MVPIGEGKNNTRLPSGAPDVQYHHPRVPKVLETGPEPASLSKLRHHQHADMASTGPNICQQHTRSHTSVSM